MVFAVGIMSKMFLLDSYLNPVTVLFMYDSLSSLSFIVLSS